MVERFLLDRIDAEAAGPPVGRQHHRVALAHPDETESPLPLVQAAGPRAHIALHPPIPGAVPVPRRDRRTAHCPPSLTTLPTGDSRRPCPDPLARAAPAGAR